MRLKVTIKNENNSELMTLPFSKYQSFILPILEKGVIHQEALKDEFNLLKGQLSFDFELSTENMNVKPYFLEIEDCFGESSEDLVKDLIFSSSFEKVSSFQVRIKLLEVENTFIAQSYTITLNKEIVLVCRRDNDNTATLSYLNFQHPILEDEFENEWLCYEFEDGTFLNHSLVERAVDLGLNNQCSENCTSFISHFDNNGPQSKLEQTLKGTALFLTNTNNALPKVNQRIQFIAKYLKLTESNERVLMALLSDIMVTPINLVINEIKAIN